MELDELKISWESASKKLEKNLTLKEENIGLIQSGKITSNLAPLYRQRIVECIFHSIAIVLLLAFILYNIREIPYAVSAAALLAFYLTTLISAVKQVRIIKKMDITDDLATTQSSLVILQTHIVNYARLAVLFIPSFLAYPVILTKIIQDFNIKAMADFDIIEKSNGNWWTLQWVTLIVLVPLGIWFYREVTYKNIHKTWVRNFIEKSSGKRVIKGLTFLSELRSLQSNF